MRIELDCLNDFPASKSQLIRAYLCQSYQASLKILNSSSAEDVLWAKEASKIIANKDDSTQLKLQAGASGAVFRFFCLRLSRIKGRHEIFGSPRLLQRSQKALLDLLTQLKVEVQQKENSWELQVPSFDWASFKEKRVLEVDMSESSQTATAALLNAWNLNFELKIKLSSKKVSWPYWEMSLAQFRQLGGQYSEYDSLYTFAPKQNLQASSYRAEPDMSSIFSVIAALIRDHEVHLKHFPIESLQADFVFVRILNELGVRIERAGDMTSFYPSNKLKSLRWDLSGSPDLFCSLAILLGFSETPSLLYGAPHLSQKESNRIASIMKIFDKLGVSAEPKIDGILIKGNLSKTKKQEFVISCFDDHRVAMAAQILIEAGFPLKLDDPTCVNKSFPDFFTLLEKCKT